MTFSAPLWLDAHLVTMCDQSGGANDGLPEASSIRPGLAGLPESRGTKTEMPIDFFAPRTSMWVSHLPPPPSSHSARRQWQKSFLFFLLFVIFNFTCFTNTQSPCDTPRRPRTETTLNEYTSRAETYLTSLHPLLPTNPSYPQTGIKLTNKPKSH